MTDEEKAEEYYYKTYPVTLNIGEEERKKVVTDIFLAGFNAGRQWHYVKDELPKNTKVCLLYLGSCFNPTTGWFKNNTWHFEENLNPDIWQEKVIAWKEIVLPKENE